MPILYARHLSDPNYNAKNLTWGGSEQALTEEEEATMVASLTGDLGEVGHAFTGGIEKCFCIY